MDKRAIISIALIMAMVLSFGAVTATPNMGNKYLVDDFNISCGEDNESSHFFNATITNQNDGATGDGYYEIKDNPAANHKDVLQNGTFTGNTGIFQIGQPLTFNPIDGVSYTILVFTNYPEHDNRVSKDTSKFLCEEDDNETDDNETDDNETDDNETDDNETDDNETDDNETDDNETNDNQNETVNNETKEIITTKTIPMQETGAPFLPALAGLIAIVGGAIYAIRRQ